LRFDLWIDAHITDVLSYAHESVQVAQFALNGNPKTYPRQHTALDCR
jgi:hypothetical protein